MRKEMIDLKHQNTGLNQLIKEIKSKNNKVSTAGPPRVYSANTQNQNTNSQQADEIRKLNFENGTLR